MNLQGAPAGENTIENDPETVFAYNNGVIATAEGIDLAMVS